MVTSTDPNHRIFGGVILSKSMGSIEEARRTKTVCVNDPSSEVAIDEDAVAHSEKHDEIQNKMTDGRENGLLISAFSKFVCNDCTRIFTSSPAFVTHGMNCKGLNTSKDVMATGLQE